MAVVQVAEERDSAVDGDHEQDADDVALLPGLGVVRRVQHNQGQGNDDGDEAEDGSEEEAEVVECEALPERGVHDVAILQGGVAETAWWARVSARSRRGAPEGDCGVRRGASKTARRIVGYNNEAGGECGDGDGIQSALRWRDVGRVVFSS